MRSLKVLIPNLLTLSRSILAGIILWLLLKEESPLNLAAILLVFALITDLIDGPIARRLDATTKFGYYLDHIVDFVLLVPILYLVWAHLGKPLFFLVLGLEIGTAIISLFHVLGLFSIKWPNNFGRASFGALGISACFILFFRSGLFPLAISGISTFVLLRILSFRRALRDLKNN